MTMITEEARMLQDLVAKFVERELIPLEPAVLAREAAGQKWALTEEEEGPILDKCKELGLWGLDVPESMGGANLDTVTRMLVEEEVSRTITPFEFPPDSPNLHMMLSVVNDYQRERYLQPYADGTAKSGIAISEPGAGGDPAGMITRARKDGTDWVINGRKIWVSRVPAADFIIVMARTGEGKRAEGMTAFIVEKNTPGFIIEREIKMIGGRLTYELVFDECRVPESQVLGELGQGYAPMQLRLNVRRLQMGARCVGMCRRAIEMMTEQAKQRVTFGVKLADRQAIQWWIADAAIKIHATRLMVLSAAEKMDAGQDVKDEASMIKVFATEMARDVLDQAMQTFGAMGMTKEMPLHLFAQQARLMRIYEGPTEVHRMAIAKRVLRRGSV
ncbi:acyl-CoA dehydrogenase family protein [Roseomonas sp. HJA6]|uniref:Acyl-CoA dehydrogenase family protein n=1 Tax=Roseomonas alba TaxID=2846776 RepID=A0ABS7A976_9PROT|nr:acyl-CoA dehydrogenase family protein [Neoroseomonas alba]MBW6398859.1 acyl-CoA dehydrogenase family protein [Neoroseomonas alba]